MTERKLKVLKASVWEQVMRELLAVTAALLHGSCMLHIIKYTKWSSNKSVQLQQRFLRPAPPEHRRINAVRRCVY